MAQILIVDDDPQIRAMFCAILRSGGHSVLEASCGTEAQQTLLGTPCDAVLTDLIMPDGHGFAIIEYCRALCSNLKVIAMSSKGNPTFDYLTYAIECGAHFAFHKASDPDRIAASIESVLAGQTLGIDSRSVAAAQRVLWPTDMLRG